MVQTGSGLKELIQQAAEKELIVAAEAGVFFSAATVGDSRDSGGGRYWCWEMTNHW